MYTVLLKELLGFEMVQLQEREQGWRYTWILLVREDMHWFAPFNLPLFRRARVHGRACATYGGWNDSIFLIWREGLAQLMLTSYVEVSKPHLDWRCWLQRGKEPSPFIKTNSKLATLIGGQDREVGQLLRQVNERLEINQHSTSGNFNGQGGRLHMDKLRERRLIAQQVENLKRLLLQPDRSFLVDSLASSNSEQLRARLGLVKRIPFETHGPNMFPVAITRFRIDNHSMCFVPNYVGCISQTSNSSCQSCVPDRWMEFVSHNLCHVMYRVIH